MRGRHSFPASASGMTSSSASDYNTAVLDLAFLPLSSASKSSRPFIRIVIIIQFGVPLLRLGVLQRRRIFSLWFFLLGQQHHHICVLGGASSFTHALGAPCNAYTAASLGATFVLQILSILLIPQTRKSRRFASQRKKSRWESDEEGRSE